MNPIEDLHSFPRTPPTPGLRQKLPKKQSPAPVAVAPVDPALTTVAMIQAVIPRELPAVEGALVTEAEAVAGPRDSRHDARPAMVRWGRRAARSTSSVSNCRSRCRASATAPRGTTPGPDLHGAVRPVLGDVPLPRSQRHKRESEAVYFPRLVNESEAGSLAEGTEETVTLHHLAVFAAVGVSLKAMRPIKSVMVRLQAKNHRVTSWRTGDQKECWCAPPDATER